MLSAEDLLRSEGLGLRIWSLRFRVWDFGLGFGRFLLSLASSQWQFPPPNAYLWASQR